MARQLEDVYCTLLMSDSYLPGASVLAHSLRDAGTKKKLAVLVTLDTLSADTITELKTLYDYIVPVERIRNPSPANLFLMGRPDLLYAFTKIALWRQTRFRKIVYLDADVVALRNLDELFDIDAPFAAAPDIGWPDAFNTGVMVLTPDMGEYWALHTMASAGDSFDGADQGLLNQYYEDKDWHRLSFTYNCTPNAQYQWEPAYRYHKQDIRAVHFIGKDKPWKTGKTGPVGFGVYNELLARWWAVHDRHLEQESAPLTDQPSLEPESPSATNDQQDVHGETTSAEPVAASTHHESEASITSTEMPLSEPGDVAEDIDQGVTEPLPTAEQPQFTAPQMEWDATKFEPPADARPEAENFPTETYVFSESNQLFNPPKTYPEPPKDMWYEVPEEKPKPAEKPRAIFPWEMRDRPKPTRVFAEDAPEPEPEPESKPSPIHTFSTVHYKPEQVAALGPSSPERASSPQNADESWQAFQQSNTNAWDSVPGIDTYVRAIFESQARRGSIQVLNPSGAPEVSSPMVEHKARRESLILTNFPSAVERPSLPVTPAPIRRPTFWGQERDEQIPQAEGVPSQAEWNPIESVERLRRSSVIEFEHLKSPYHPEPPLRALPEHSVPQPDEDLRPRPPSNVPRTKNITPNEKPRAARADTFVESEFSKTEAQKLLFREPDFSLDGAGDEKTRTTIEEDLLSPTQKPDPIQAL